MTLHFTREEFAERQGRGKAAIAAQGLDGMILFAPESHFYLCGFDTFGFAMFQCLIMTAEGRLELFVRTPDLRQAQITSTLSDDQIHVWPDVEGVNPADELKKLLSAMGLEGKKLGVEMKTAGLTAYNWQLLSRSMEGFATIVDASDVISLTRRVKSPQEIEYHRKAAELSDQGLDEAIRLSGPGAFDGDVLAAMQGVVFQGGGDYAGNEFIVGSGEQGLLCRYSSGRRKMDANDQLTLEWSGAFARYHAAMMRTLVIGKANDHQKRMHAATVEALEACETAIRPGDPMGNVYAAHAEVFDRHGFGDARMKACGYGMGAIYNPIWVDFPMFYENNPLVMNAGNVFFLHMILMDSETGHAMCWGHSVLVKDGGVERLSRSSLDMVECL